MCTWTCTHDRTQVQTHMGRQALGLACTCAQARSSRTGVGREIRGQSRHRDCNVAELPSHFPPSPSPLPSGHPLLVPFSSSGLFLPWSVFSSFSSSVLSSVPLFSFSSSFFCFCLTFTSNALHVSSSCFLPLVSHLPPSYILSFPSPPSPALLTPSPSLSLHFPPVPSVPLPLFSILPLFLHPSVTAASRPPQHSQI